MALEVIGSCCQEPLRVSCARSVLWAAVLSKAPISASFPVLAKPSRWPGTCAGSHGTQSSLPRRPFGQGQSAKRQLLGAEARDTSLQDCTLQTPLQDLGSCELRAQDGIPCLPAPQLRDSKVAGRWQFRWFPAPKAATVILFFHANAEAIPGRRLLSDSPWIDRLQSALLGTQDLGMSFAILKHMRDQFKAASTSSCVGVA